MAVEGVIEQIYEKASADEKREAVRLLVTLSRRKHVFERLKKKQRLYQSLLLAHRDEKDPEYRVEQCTDGECEEQTGSCMCNVSV